MDWSQSDVFKEDISFCKAGPYHFTHLIRNVLEPVLCSFDTLDHGPELVANNSLIEKWLSENFPLVSPSDSVNQIILL
jgi:hypothetical protein